MTVDCALFKPDIQDLDHGYYATTIIVAINYHQFVSLLLLSYSHLISNVLASLDVAALGG